jgi:hypothetical protein
MVSSTSAPILPSLRTTADSPARSYLYNWQVRPIAGGCPGEATQPLSIENRRPTDEQPVVGGRVVGSGIGLVMM